ncbi:MAG: hypothetical protein DDT19_01963 [Syntrophomonadaceae bacterium]|nr:hypothetical protein [Bacillota bacterium]
MNRAQTSNSFLTDKVMLRLDNLPPKKTIKVLDCFAGFQLVWNEVIKLSKKNIIYVPIEKKNSTGAFLAGNNLKFLRAMNLSEFDVIDLDSYGIPYGQLNIIFSRGFRGIIFVTFIQSLFGRLPQAMLKELGYSSNMLKKVPTLFNRNGFEKFKLYLAINGVKFIRYKNYQKKYYLYIKRG